MHARLAFVVSALLLSFDTVAADKLEQTASGWKVYSSVDRMTDQAECYARNKQGLFMWWKTGVYAPVERHSTAVQYRYDGMEPRWKSLDLDESKHTLIELSVYRPTEPEFDSGDVGKLSELRVESEHVFGKKKFARYSLAGSSQAFEAIMKCRAKYNVKDLYSDRS